MLVQVAWFGRYINLSVENQLVKRGIRHGIMRLSAACLLKDWSPKILRNHNNYFF